MTIIWPNRVWESGSSREPTDEDYKRRRLVSELLRSETSPERKEEIRKELESL